MNLERQSRDRFFDAEKVFEPFAKSWCSARDALAPHKREFGKLLGPMIGDDARDGEWHRLVGAALLHRANSNGEEDGDFMFDQIAKVSTLLKSAREQVGRLQRTMPDQIQLLLLSTEDRSIFDLATDKQMAALIALADSFAQSRSSRQHRGITCPVPHVCVSELAGIFERCTGRKPGSGKGPFARFVSLFWNAIGYGRSEDAIIKDIKSARRI